jgi:hypothetical protein
MTKSVSMMVALSLCSTAALAQSGGGSANGNGGPDTTQQQVIVLRVDCRGRCEPDPFALYRRKFDAARPIKASDLPHEEMVFIDFNNRPPVSHAISDESSYSAMLTSRVGSLIYLNKRGYFMTAGSMLLYPSAYRMRRQDGTVSPREAQLWVDQFVKPGVQDLQGMDGEERLYHREMYTDNYLVIGRDYFVAGHNRSTIRITEDGELIVKKEFCFTRNRNDWVEYGYLIANLKQGIALPPR